MQSLPKVNVMQKPGTSINTANIQQQIASGAQIITANPAANQGAKTALIGTNVVKLVSPAAVSGNKILMKNSNLVQVGKVNAAAGKPSFVITNKQGQPIRTNQQFIFVTTAGGIRTVQTGSIVTSAANNFVSLVSSPQINTITPAIASGTNSVQTAPGTVKMIRGVGQQGKPITFTLPVSNLQGNKGGSPQLISMPQKGLTIGGKAVTVQLAPGNQKTVTIVSSASGGIQKTINAADLQAGGHKIVMMPSKRVANMSNVITHKAIPMSATQLADAGNDPNADNNLIEGSHLEVLDQLDGAFDMDSDNESRRSCSDDDDDDAVSSDDYELSELKSRNAIKRESTKRHSRKLAAARASGVRKPYQDNLQKRALKKIVPKYVKMGLFGGSPYTNNDPNEPESTTEHETDGANNESNANAEDQEMGEAHDASISEADSNAANQHSTDEDNQALADEQQKHEGGDASSEYLNTSGTEANAAEDYLNSGAEQKPETEQIQSQQPSGRHAEPTPSDTEAANILTTIKSGDLLRNNDSKDGTAATTIAITTLASPTTTSSQQIDDNVKILFNSEPVSKSISNSGNVAIKTVQKTTAGAVTTYSATSNTGDLDALASAALQASSGRFFH